MEQSIPEMHAKASRQRQITANKFATLLAALGDTPKEPGIHYERLRSKLIFFFSRRQLQFPEDMATMSSTDSRIASPKESRLPLFRPLL